MFYHLFSFGAYQNQITQFETHTIVKITQVADRQTDILLTKKKSLQTYLS